MVISRMTIVTIHIRCLLTPLITTHEQAGSSKSSGLVYPKGPSTQLSYTLKNSILHNYYPKPEYLIMVRSRGLGLRGGPARC